MSERLAAAIRAAAPRAPQAAIGGFFAVLDMREMREAVASDDRAATLIGQCAHESLGFTRTVESLYYTTSGRLMAVWPSRFRREADCAGLLRNPEALANRVYGGRLGNGPEGSGDGWRYRGRGLLHLTGRANYARLGRRLGLPLEDEPELAEGFETGWRVAADFLWTRARAGRHALDWADAGNVEMVTRIVNGGLHGLDDRRARTAAARSALRRGAVRLTNGAPIVLRRGDDGPDVMVLQRRLVQAGHPLGAVDGDFGPRTEAALRAFQRAAGIEVDGVAGPGTEIALERVLAARAAA